MINSITSSNHITIVTATDNHYVILLAALIKSVEVNHVSDEIIDIYIVGDKLSDDNIGKLKGSYTSPKIVLHFLKMNEVIPKDMNLPLDKSSWPLNIYMRLFIPYFLPKEISRIIYLDVDMIALKDVSLLWSTDLKGKIIGAVKDQMDVVSNPWGGILNYKNFGMESTDNYFNSGLLVIDREKWEGFEVTKKVIQCVDANKEFANFPDQYGLNVVLHKNWLSLPPQWNCFSNIDMEDPHIIHFYQRKPIYKTYDKNPVYKDLFYKFLNQTKWQGHQPVSETSRYIKKIKNIIEKIKINPFK